MSRHRIGVAVLGVLTALSLGGEAARAGATTNYTIDILSKEFYPELSDSWMTRINNQGVAAGYVATAKSGFPYLPASYSGGGNFKLFGNASGAYGGVVNAFNDHGVAAGTLNYSKPYLYQNGVVSYPVLPTSFSDASLENLNNNGLAAGSAVDNDDETYKVFLVQRGAVQVLPLGTAEFPSVFTSSKLLSDAGLLGVTTVSPDFEVYRAMLYNTATATLAALEVPTGFVNAGLIQITASELIFGSVSDADYSNSRYGFWNTDGSFREYLDTPDELRNISINNLGQAVGLGPNNNPYFYDGAEWRALTIPGLENYKFSQINDLNDRGEFVGLVAEVGGTGFRWGFVASPAAVPEPGSLTLAVLGLVSLGAYAKSGSRRGRSR